MSVYFFSSRIRVVCSSILVKHKWQIFVLWPSYYYVVQGHRFGIIEGYGCRPTTYFSIAAIFIVWLPPLILSIGAIAFAGLVLRPFIQCRISFATHLATHSALSYAIWFTVVSIPICPWMNWADVHSNFSRIDLYPALFHAP
ncbi:STE3-like pheromone receptor [Laccaria bicolor S238N-H82]|uniref:STE3-like pheromone receptor n=1 Tax=Laccaria bicolor (strain S238N-H82 / ATCC MYA-4686) TaxID=486041 RepID=B0DF16_LACBS|nr:STE3-like pheromone receptor [Laccaria bicolor S238N-H82]EDR06641.1 STE3-like pheromone receptor [Laccaria bicolor S238N-H82]|eukprot:XP_001882488.1 STE3-like pheromone receptor [Laccaria bicolor S238N-H82]